MSTDIYEIREWVSAIGTLLAGIGAIVGTGVTIGKIKKKPKRPLEKTEIAAVLSDDVPVTPEMRKQWEWAFIILFIGIFGFYISVNISLFPYPSELLSNIFLFGGLLFLVECGWAAFLFGRKAVYMHEQRAMLHLYEKIRCDRNKLTSEGNATEEDREAQAGNVK